MTRARIGVDSLCYLLFGASWTLWEGQVSIAYSGLPSVCPPSVWFSDWELDWVSIVGLLVCATQWEQNYGRTSIRAKPSPTGSDYVQTYLNHSTLRAEGKFSVLLLLLERKNLNTHIHTFMLCQSR